MHASLLLSLLALISLARWSHDQTLSKAAEDWMHGLRAERCLALQGRAEAGRRNLQAAGLVLGQDPAAALAHWDEQYPVPDCPMVAPSFNLQWSVRQETHPSDRGVNWVAGWRWRS